VFSILRFLEFLITCCSKKEAGEEGVGDPSFWSGTFGGHLFYADDIVAYLLEGHSDVLCRSIGRKMPGNGFNLFIDLCKVKIMLRPTVSLSWNKALIWGLNQVFITVKTVACFLMWGRSL
jgi:hypothetical protein